MIFFGLSIGAAVWLIMLGAGAHLDPPGWIGVGVLCGIAGRVVAAIVDREP